MVSGLRPTAEPRTLNLIENVCLLRSTSSQGWLTVPFPRVGEGLEAPLCVILVKHLVTMYLSPLWYWGAF